MKEISKRDIDIVIGFVKQCRVIDPISREVIAERLNKPISSLELELALKRISPEELKDFQKLVEAAVNNHRKGGIRRLGGIEGGN